nr:MAG TPA: hypothetical protein [Caudoviricetes sp.]
MVFLCAFSDRRDEIMATSTINILIICIAIIILARTGR